MSYILTKLKGDGFKNDLFLQLKKTKVFLTPNLNLATIFETPEEAIKARRSQGWAAPLQLESLEFRKKLLAVKTKKQAKK